jgi:hypothetical protein
MQLNNRDSIIEHAMPGWNGNESIVGYIIRKRDAEREARAIRIARRNRILLLINLTGWPLAALATVALTQAFIG